MKLIPKGKAVIYETDFTDTLLQIKETGPDEQPVAPPVLDNYRKKVEFYLKQHEDIPAIRKLRNNEPMQKVDMDDLEDLLWNRLGTEEQYHNEYQTNRWENLYVQW